MKFEDIRIGQIVCIESSATYGLVVGILNECNRADYLYKGYWDSIYIAFMPFGDFAFSEKIKGVSSMESFKCVLRDCAKELFSKPLEFDDYGYGVPVHRLRAVDIKPLTKEVRNWMLKTSMIQSKEEQQQMAYSILSKAKETEFLSLYKDISGYIKRIQNNLKSMRPYKGEKIKKGTILVENNEQFLLFYSDTEYLTFKFGIGSDLENLCLFVISSKLDYAPCRLYDDFFSRSFCILDVNVFDCKANKELVKELFR